MAAVGTTEDDGEAHAAVRATEEVAVLTNGMSAAAFSRQQLPSPDAAAVVKAASTQEQQAQSVHEGTAERAQAQPLSLDVVRQDEQPPLSPRVVERGEAAPQQKEATATHEQQQPPQQREEEPRALTSSTPSPPLSHPHTPHGSRLFSYTQPRHQRYSPRTPQQPPITTGTRMHASTLPDLIEPPFLTPFMPHPPPFIPPFAFAPPSPLPAPMLFTPPPPPLPFVVRPPLLHQQHFPISPPPPPPPKHDLRSVASPKQHHHHQQQQQLPTSPASSIGTPASPGWQSVKGASKAHGRAEAGGSVAGSSPIASPTSPHKKPLRSPDSALTNLTAHTRSSTAEYEEAAAGKTVGGTAMVWNPAHGTVMPATDIHLGIGNHLPPHFLSSPGSGQQQAQHLSPSTGQQTQHLSGQHLSGQHLSGQHLSGQQQAQHLSPSTGQQTQHTLDSFTWQQQHIHERQQQHSWLQAHQASPASPAYPPSPAPTPTISVSASTPAAGSTAGAASTVTEAATHSSSEHEESSSISTTQPPPPPSRAVRVLSFKDAVSSVPPSSPLLFSRTYIPPPPPPRKPTAPLSPLSPSFSPSTTPVDSTQQPQSAPSTTHTAAPATQKAESPASSAALLSPEAPKDSLLLSLPSPSPLLGRHSEGGTLMTGELLRAAHSQGVTGALLGQQHISSGTSRISSSSGSSVVVGRHSMGGGVFGQHTATDDSDGCWIWGAEERKEGASSAEGSEAAAEKTVYSKVLRRAL